MGLDNVNGNTKNGFKVVSFRVSGEIREYLEEKGNVSDFLRSLVESDMQKKCNMSECPFCEHLRIWGNLKKGELPECVTLSSFQRFKNPTLKQQA